MQPRFRSILPHEPLPTEEEGYIHISGAFEPKVKKVKKDDDKQSHDNPTEASFWTTSDLHDALLQIFTNGSNIQLPHNAQGIEVLNASPPFNKVRLRYKSPMEAHHVVLACKSQKLSPSDLFITIKKDFNFGSRPLQVSLITCSPLLPCSEAWARGSPPKFRRLLARPGEDMEPLKKERESTRFVYMTGLLNPEVPIPNFWNVTTNVVDVIRQVVTKLDTSGKGVEVFVSHKKMAQYCYIGMRSPADAQKLISSLQGEEVEWKWSNILGGDKNDEEVAISSGKLFLDYAAITKRSADLAEAKEKGIDLPSGEPSRSECTSATNDVVVPGLILVPDFLSPREEEVIMAAVNGPCAPWAPAQINRSKSGAVKRKVQHYGYVFDYETADVLRDRSFPNSTCPPMPAPPENESLKSDNLEDWTKQCVDDGRAWETLAGIIERTRCTDFSQVRKSEDNLTVASSPGPLVYPQINQLTVNHYEPGEGIGSHTDTRSAFSDGLISISLNSGIVMEFRNPDAEKVEDSRKLVYLPRRSLVLMSGPARFQWEHMIVSRTTDTNNGTVIPRSLRVSLTLRTAIDLDGNPMPLVQSNRFPPIWGAEKERASSSENALVTPAVEREHVHALYDAIATQWHHTRGKRGVLWPGATQFLQALPAASIVADVGCGDGKYFPAIWEAGSYVIGTDISRPLLQTSIRGGSEKNAPETRRVSENRHHLCDRPAVAVADCMSVPIRTKCCDAAICIAVLHHLSTKERRLQCLKELSRIVKVGGMINLQAWAMEQEEKSKRKFNATDVFVPFNAQPKYLDGGVLDKDKESVPSSKSTAEVYSKAHNAKFDEKKGLVVFNRYCHLYRKGELEELVSELPSLTVAESGYESGNWFMILKVLS